MKRLLAVLCSLLVFGSMLNVVTAYSENFELAARDSATREIVLAIDDRLSGRITILGKSINFSVTDPDGRIVLDQTIAGTLDLQFTANKTGTYRLLFENLFSDETKSITLNYNVQRYIFGFPQEFIILFVIVGFALIGIVVFVAMSPKP
jgi:hypothetical protein